MKNVLICGAGVAGPSLAYWLGRRGVACTVVERAPALRQGGQAVDFRGPVHRAVLERMDLWRAIHERRTSGGDVVLLDRRGASAAVLPAVMTAGDVEILRGDLSRLLHERTRDFVEYRFGDRVAALERHEDRVDATFASGARGSYDVVVGADGLHSSVRALAFGDEGLFLKHHGYRIAAFEMAERRDARLLVYSAPGRATAIASGRALLVYRGGPFGEERWDLAAQKRALRATYDGVGWEVPRVLDALDAANDVFLDAIATVHVDGWSRGRAVLLGDAAWGGTLGGQGTSLAMVGAYVLAGELAHGEPSTAFQRYESRMRAYAMGCQKGAMRVGGFFAPKTWLGISVRNFVYRALTSRFLVGFFERLVKDAASDFALPHYAT